MSAEATADLETALTIETAPKVKNTFFHTRKNKTENIFFALFMIFSKSEKSQKITLVYISILNEIPIYFDEEPVTF